MSRQFSPLPKQKTTHQNNTNAVSSASHWPSLSSFKISHILTVGLLFMRNVTGGASQRLGHGYRQHVDYGMLGHHQHHDARGSIIGSQADKNSYTTLLKLCENYRDNERTEVRRLLEYWNRPYYKNSAPLHGRENPLDIAKRNHDTALARLVLRTTQDQYCQNSHSSGAYLPDHGQIYLENNNGLQSHRQFEIAAEMANAGCPVEVSPIKAPHINNINLLDAMTQGRTYPIEAVSIIKHLLSAFSIHHPEEKKILRKAAIYAIHLDQPKLIELFIEHGVEPFPIEMPDFDDELLLHALLNQKKQGKPQKSVRVLLNQINTSRELGIATKILQTAEKFGCGDAEAKLMIDELFSIVVGGLKSQTIVDHAVTKYPDMMLVSFFQLHYHMIKEQYSKAKITVLEMDKRFKHNPFYQRNVEQYRILLGQFEETIRYAPITKRGRKNLDDHQVFMNMIAVMSKPHPIAEMLELQKEKNNSHQAIKINQDIIDRLKITIPMGVHSEDIDTQKKRLFSEGESYQLPAKVRTSANKLFRSMLLSRDDSQKSELITETLQLLLYLENHLIYTIHPQLAYLTAHLGILMNNPDMLVLSLKLALPQHAIPMLDDELLPGIEKLCEEEPEFMSEVFFQDIILSRIDTLDEHDSLKEERAQKLEELVEKTLGIQNKAQSLPRFYGDFSEDDALSIKAIQRINHIIDFVNKYDITTPSVTQIVMEQVEYITSIIDERATPDYKQVVSILQSKAMNSKLHKHQSNGIMTTIFATILTASLMATFFMSKKAKNKSKPNDNHEPNKINRTTEKPHQSAKSAPQYNYTGELEKVEFNHLKGEQHRCFITLPMQVSEKFMADADILVKHYVPRAEKITPHVIARALKLGRDGIKEKISIEEVESNDKFSLIISIKNNKQTFYDVFNTFMTQFEKGLINNLPGIVKQRTCNKLSYQIEKTGELIETMANDIEKHLNLFSKDTCERLKSNITTLESHKTTPFVSKNINKIHKALKRLENHRNQFTRIKFQRPNEVKKENLAQLEQCLKSLEEEATPIQFAYTEISKLVSDLNTSIENLREQDLRSIIKFKFDLASANKTSSAMNRSETKTSNDINHDNPIMNDTTSDTREDDNSADDDNDVASEESSSEEASSKESESPIIDDNEDNAGSTQQIAEPKELTQEEIYRITCDPSLFKVINPSKQVSSQQQSSASSSASAKSSRVNNKERALISHVEMIIEAIKDQSHQLLDSIELTRRKSIYALIDLFARLNLGLLTMEKNQLIAKYSLSRNVGDIRDVLRHNAMCYIYAGDDLSQHRMLHAFCEDLTHQLTRAINKKPLAKKPNAAIFAKIQLKETLTASDLLTGLNEDINFLTRVQSKLSHEGSQARRQHHTFFLGMISQIGNQCQKLKSIDSALYSRLCIGNNSSRYVNIEDLFTEKVSADRLSIQQILSLCLQVRNIRGHEQDDDSQLPQYHARQMRYRDHFDAETLNRLINVISERAKDIASHVNRVHQTLVDGQVSNEAVGAIAGLGNK